jgi:uncharacterized sporulation protein YeaH/YhbH (DUF444 family)
MSDEYIDVVFDGPPSHESGRFVEVEDTSGRSIKFGEWVQRDDGFWALRIDDLRAQVERLTTELEASQAIIDALQRRVHLCAGYEALERKVERLEAELAAEKASDAESLAMYRRVRDERDALRAEVERLTMAVGWMYAYAYANIETIRSEEFPAIVAKMDAALDAAPKEQSDA